MFVLHLWQAFQSTPSAWRVTTSTYTFRRYETISIHTLRMEGDHDGSGNQSIPGAISIHTLRMEGDGHDGSRVMYKNISIHTLRVEGDRPLRSSRRRKSDFNPHPPRGG